ncbi:MAG: DUF6314 family protein [Pseudomonadota bacterium]
MAAQMAEHRMADRRAGTGLTPDGLIAGLAGVWQLCRAIDDRLGDGPSRFDGEATFTPGEGGLDYVEIGHLVLPDGSTLAGHRAYAWRIVADRIHVTFPDGRPFHEFDPAKAVPTAVHLCEPDTYRVSYNFDLPDLWRAVWDVGGPRKDYRMESTYTRF